nr:hypothetical protein [Amycolatopsis sp. Hca4]
MRAVSAVTLQAPSAPAVVERVWPPTVTVTGLGSGASLVPEIVGVVSLVTKVAPPSIVTVGGGASVNRMVAGPRVTAARESTRPMITVSAPTVIAPCATIVPDRNEFAPVFAASPATQYTLAPCAPLTRSTWLAAAVSNAASVRKTNTASGLPWASRVTVPVMAIAATAWCTPGVKVRPPSSPTTSAPAGLVDRSP